MKAGPTLRSQPIIKVDVERARCASLVKALIDSRLPVTAMALVITAEKIGGGPPCAPDVLLERERCIRIIDAATAMDFRDKPGAWAMQAILDGTEVGQTYPVAGRGQN